MKIDLDIAGTPAEVRSQLADAANAARRNDPHANIVVSALNDLIGRKLAGAGPDAQLVARVLIDISDATGLTEQLRDFVERPRNEVQRAQQAAIASERPAAEGSRAIPVVQINPVSTAVDAALSAGIAAPRASEHANAATATDTKPST